MCQDSFSTPSTIPPSFAVNTSLTFLGIHFLIYTLTYRTDFSIIPPQIRNFLSVLAPEAVGSVSSIHTASVLPVALFTNDSFFSYLTAYQTGWLAMRGRHMGRSYHEAVYSEFGSKFARALPDIPHPHRRRFHPSSFPIENPLRDPFPYTRMTLFLTEMPGAGAGEKETCLSPTPRSPLFRFYPSRSNHTGSGRRAVMNAARMQRIEITPG